MMAHCLLQKAVRFVCSVDFLIIALTIFFMIKGVTKLTELRKKKEVEAPAAPAPAPEPSAEEKLLTEIRDLLKKQ
ncbi:MAG: MscL family protein [Bacteroidaceae bacterium]|nr:MscL family protein [Bacteroidaceae bacterium]